MNQIYVGNLPYKTRESELRDFFSSCGEVTEARIIKDKRTRRSKGYAFVVFASSNSAQQAIEKLNGEILNGRNLKVSLANPEKPHSERTEERGSRSSKGGLLTRFARSIKKMFSH